MTKKKSKAVINLNDEGWPEVELSDGEILIKIQRSIWSSCDSPQMVIYNKTRDVYYEADLSPEVADIMGRRLRVYAVATLVGTQLCISRILEGR